jgi:hypothetical protein
VRTHRVLADIMIARNIVMRWLSKREFVSGLLKFMCGPILGTVLILILGFLE